MNLKSGSTQRSPSNIAATSEEVGVVPVPDFGTKNGGRALAAPQHHPTVRAGTFKTTTDVRYTAAFGVMRTSAGNC
jgi:hypothetical protein